MRVLSGISVFPHLGEEEITRDAGGDFGPVLGCGDIKDTFANYC
jgi:hypothetical protein